MTDQNQQDELVIYFQDTKTEYLIIAIPEQLIGIPNNHAYLLTNFILYLTNDGAKFKVVNDPSYVEDKFIKDYKISGDTIEFSTFNDLTKLGSKIIIRKNELPK